MILQGKHNTAEVFTDIIDQKTISQIIQLLNQPFAAESKIRIMPDCHAGSGCVIGTTMTLKDKVVPNLVGVDIGCGVLAIKLKEQTFSLKKLDETIRNYVPNGPDVYQDPILYNLHLKDLICTKTGRIREGLAHCSLGSLGGGNHFIEVDYDHVEHALWLVIHSGSRHLGIEVCQHYQKMAYEQRKFETNHGNFETKSAELIQSLKAAGKSKEISKQLAAFKKNYRDEEPPMPYDLCYCDGELFDAYIHDMKIVQEHAVFNRNLIAKQILEHMGLHEVDRIESIHNYIDTEHMILRKGAVSAYEGERLIIPMNMRDGSLICVGKGNEAWNCSAPHGAGRLYSRSAAKETFSLEEYRKEMDGIYSTSVCQGTLDECPMAYKAIEDIIPNIIDNVEYKARLKPIYNFKASESPNTADRPFFNTTILED